MNNQKKTYDLYIKFLSTLKIDHKNILRLPVATKILKSLINIDTLKNKKRLNKITDYTNIYYWSDLHINHDNVIKYSNRPFNDKDEMFNFFINEYNKIIKDDDIVIFGGDIVFNQNKDILKRLNEFKGKKYLILGNHDIDKKTLEYKKYQCFEDLMLCHSFIYEYNHKIIEVIITHYPIDEDFLPENTINIHGHTHQYLISERHINMCVEHTDYKPIKLIDKIKEKF